MRAFDAMRRHRSALASGAVLTVTGVVVTTLAALYQGIPTADVELDDGGVWVTREDDLLVGHLNHPSRVLDGAVRTSGGGFDVLQDGDTVLVTGAGGASLTAIDPAAVALADSVALPEGAVTVLGGTTLGILAQGAVYSVAVDALPSAVFDETSAAVTVGADGAVAVADGGSAVYAVAPGSSEVTAVDAAGGEASTVDVGDIAADASLQIAAVGEVPVVFDRSSGTLFLPGGSTIELPDAVDGQLQESSPASDHVVVATSTALVTVDLEGYAVNTVDEVPEGEAARPRQLGGCDFAVWSGTGEYRRDCAGEAEDFATTLDGAETSSGLVLRSNHRAVVVNDVGAGTVWVVDDSAVRVDNWDDVVPPPDDDGDDESEDETPQLALPERTAANEPPVAVDDEFGVRAGRSTILRVTDNDTDPDGDLLAAALDGDPPPLATVDPVLAGAALQVALPVSASGSSTFSYRVEDGRGGSDTGSVRLDVVPDEVNTAPVQLKVNTLQVEAGQAVSYAALDGWRDPEGDDFFLRSAAVDGGDTVSFRSNGVITYTAASGVPGIHEVRLVVSDGRDEAEGVVRVDVRPEGSLSPVANSDRFTAVAGVATTLEPLANDLSLSGGRLAIASCNGDPGATLTPDYSGGTIAFVAASAGTYYVQYLLTDGTPRTAVGIIRVDVVAADAAAAPPIAARDVAMLPAGRLVLVDVLANDTDPAGGVLVVQTARAPQGSGVTVEVLEHSVLRVTDASGISGPVTVTYTVSNGTGSAVGEVLVMPIPMPDRLRAPIAVADSADVRVGDVVSIPVLANDFHPDGDTISLLPGVTSEDAAPGTYFVDGNRLRFQAPDEPTTVHVIYEIADSQQNRVATLVTIRVRAADAATNSPPRAQAVTARVIAGTTTRIAIPLDGIDADGDSVELVGPSSNPAKGTVTAGDTWFVYEAFPTATGRDTFTYTVRDRLGATAEGAVTVGIAVPGAENQAPYATRDEVTVRPGRTVSVAVLANDTDPDGDEVTILRDGLVVPDGVSAEVVAGRVRVEVPDGAGEYSIGYGIVDAFGAQATGQLFVVADPESALEAPVARDDRVKTTQVDDDLSVVVTVLENDEDPDGTVDDLDVSTTVRDVVVRAGRLTIPVLDDPRIVRYAVTDLDGLEAQAFVFVPGASTLVPTLATTEPIEVLSGETVSVALADHVWTRPDRTPLVATVDSVRAAHSDGSPLVDDERTLRYTSAPGYFGPDSLGVLVTDGSGPDDPDGFSAYVVIPVRVIPATNQPPTLRGATLTVAPNEAAATLDLDRLATDPDEGDDERLTFSIDGAVPDGFTASVSRGVLSASATSAAVGTTGSLRVTVSDGVNAPVSATVLLSVVSSRRQLPVAVDDSVPRAPQGEPQRVAVLVNDVNPFAGEEPLTIVAASVESDSGSARIDGDRVVVTPDDDFVGTMVVRYRIQDATGSSDRQSEARIFLTVRGEPEAPGTPTVISIQDRTVVLSWTPPYSNGAPITGYTVTSSRGTTTACAATTCTIGGLTNDVEYTFQVIAVNEMGQSPASPSSAPARPDARPDAPNPPTLAFGDRSLTVSWQTPRSNGSAVSGYNLEISPAPPSGAVQKTGVTGNSTVWSGLANGTAYTVRVQALNRAPEPSEWSGSSAPQVPAGVPDAPAAPSTSRLDPVGSQAQMRVSWTPPADNGAAISAYDVTVSRSGAADRTVTVAGDATSADIALDTSTSDYTFTVAARNKAGLGAPSAPSTPARAFTPPGATSITSVAEGDNSVRVAYTAASPNGADRVDYEYNVNGTGWRSDWDQTTISGSQVGNNGTYTVQVRASSSADGVRYDGPASAPSAQFAPYGPVQTPGAGASASGTSITYSWSPSARNGRDIVKVQISIDGEGWRDVAVGGGSEARPHGYAENHSIRVRAYDAAGQVSNEATASARTVDPPQKVMTISQPNGGIDVHLEVRGFEANRSLNIACWVTPGADGQGGRSIGSFTVVTSAGGTGSWDWPATCQMTGGGYGNLRLGNEVWSNTIKLN